MLGNTIALLALAAFFGVEAYKSAASRTPKYVLSALALATFLAAVFLQKLTEAFPKVGTFIASMFDDASSWLVLSVGLFFILRPLWTRALNTEPENSTSGATTVDSTVNEKLSEINIQIADQQNEIASFSNRIVAIEGMIEQRMRNIEQAISDISMVAGAEQLLPKASHVAAQLAEKKAAWHSYIETLAEQVRNGADLDRLVRRPQYHPPINLPHSVGMNWPDDTIPPEQPDTHGMDEPNLRKKYIQEYNSYLNAMHQYSIFEKMLSSLHEQCQSILNLNADLAESKTLARWREYFNRGQ